ncbi:MAG: DUF3131 domain-containing protein [Gemmatimonadota bacterium]
MNKLIILAVGSITAGAATLVSLAGGKTETPAAVAVHAARAAGADVPAYAPAVLRAPADVDAASEARVIADAAKTAWVFIDRAYSPSTGFVTANPNWPYPTIWDIGSALAAYYSARGLGYISDAEYRKRTRTALETLAAARMYHDIAYGRNYDSRTGELVGLDQKPARHGTGYSAIDLGRLLVWLKIVARSDPALAPLASRIAERLDERQLIRDGYLRGEQVTKTRTAKYQEGRLGYEQYAATGFALWGMNASRALKMAPNVRKSEIMDIPIWADKRGLDRLTSEPFIMHGLEIGLTGEMRELAWQTLSLQAKRYAETGQITMASEDALNDKPHYFYYYCVYCSGKAFTINVHKPGVNLDQPRWISSKAAYAWHVLLPSKYTWLAVQAVEPARASGRGWASGIYEKTGKSTGVMSLNTAAVILESALYYKTGKPFLAS